MKSSVLLYSYSLCLFNLVFFFLVTESTTLQNSKREGSIKDLMFSMSRFRIPRTLILNTGKQKTISTLYVKLFLTYHLNNCLSSLVVSDYPSSVSGGFGKRAGMFLGISIYQFYPIKNNHSAFFFREFLYSNFIKAFLRGYQFFFLIGCF